MNEETFVIMCEKDMLRAGQSPTGFIALAQVQDLTNPKLLRKLLLQIEKHFVELGNCANIES
jgi:hypothetical protein